MKTRYRRYIYEVNRFDDLPFANGSDIYKRTDGNGFLKLWEMNFFIM